VRLFGAAQTASGLKDVTMQVSSPATESTLAQNLAEALPELVGPVVREDLAGLLSSYTFNLNGLKFVRGDSVEIAPSDTLLLFSSLAGG
jgi:molybdopterin converting factor small subunit